MTFSADPSASPDVPILSRLLGVLSLLRTDSCELCGETSLLQEELGGFCGPCVEDILSAPGPFLLESSPRVWAAREYSGEMVQAIRVLKNPGHRKAAPVLADLLLRPLYRKLQESWMTEDDLVVVPVPASPAGRRSRGFDQARLLGRALSSREALLVKRSRGRAQKVLSREERRENAGSHFSPSRRIPPEAVPRRVVLVDDVVTTGATIGRCGEILQQLGVEEWGALLLAVRL